MLYHPPWENPKLKSRLEDFPSFLMRYIQEIVDFHNFDDKFKLVKMEIICKTVEILSIQKVLK